jgi:hypothetical protein
MIIEKQECAPMNGTPCRCVAFADGHVEALTHEEFQQRVAPYLAYR